MLVMMLQIFKSAGFTKTQKSKYCETKTIFSSNKENSFITHQALLYDKE